MTYINLVQAKMTQSLFIFSRNFQAAFKSLISSTPLICKNYYNLPFNPLIIISHYAKTIIHFLVPPKLPLKLPIKLPIKLSIKLPFKLLTQLPSKLLTQLPIKLPFKLLTQLPIKLPPQLPTQLFIHFLVPPEVAL